MTCETPLEVVGSNNTPVIIDVGYLGQAKISLLYLCVMCIGTGGSGILYIN